VTYATSIRLSSFAARFLREPCGIMASGSSHLAPGGLRNLLCRPFSEGDTTGPQPELLGTLGWLQILGDGRTFRWSPSGRLPFSGFPGFREDRARIPFKPLSALDSATVIGLVVSCHLTAC
jgi:hypothetical protein